MNTPENQKDLQSGCNNEGAIVNCPKVALQQTLITETNNINNNLLKCRDIISISVMNVRTILQQHKREELVQLCNEHKLNIIGIVDHKILIVVP